MDRYDLQRKTKIFTVKVLKLVDSLPKSRAVNMVANQMARSAGSVGANYRAVCRAKSTKDFISKMYIVQEEADETMYWLEILIELDKVEIRDAEKLIDEANQIVAITVASIKTVGKKIQKSKSKNQK